MMDHSVLPISAQPRRGTLKLPAADSFMPTERGAFCLSKDGELQPLSFEEARRRAVQDRPLLCHTPTFCQHIGLSNLAAYDVLELFAFIHPGRFCVPTPRGLAQALNLLEPTCPEEDVVTLNDAVRHLLLDITSMNCNEQKDIAALATMMGLMGEDQTRALGWPWAPFILSAISPEIARPTMTDIRRSLKVWERIEKEPIRPPRGTSTSFDVKGNEVQDRLSLFLPSQPEKRSQQKDYAAAVTAAFQPVNSPGETHMVVAEGGTGVGKTLGYLAPATLWAEKNDGPVWVSTYTRHLQGQVHAELQRIWSQKRAVDTRVVVRKGRENYVCLLNLEEATQSMSWQRDGAAATALGLMVRWIGATQDGDLAGSDFPGWLPDLLGIGRIYGLADRRGECIYSACPHFDRCFVEKTIRRARYADIVIANHALLMSQIGKEGDEGRMPTRYVLDEGHHLFSAADSAFSAKLNGQQTAELRRWLFGFETGHRSRLRGLRRRVEDLITEDAEAISEVDEILLAARVLPGPQWFQRLQAGTPQGSIEKFLHLCRQQVYARNQKIAHGYSLETLPYPPLPDLIPIARHLQGELRSLQNGLLRLASRFERKLLETSNTLESTSRERLQFLISGLRHRGQDMVGAWAAMLESLVQDYVTENPETLTWLEVTRDEGGERDVGMHRHYIDPMPAFAALLKPHASGIVVTSATLRDVSVEDMEGWKHALQTTAAPLLSLKESLQCFSASSPFDYKARTRIFVVGDVSKNDPAQVAAAYRALFLASGGGALGLFTAVQRLKSVYRLLAEPLTAKGIKLYAQHVSGLEMNALIDIFRIEEEACLLGTDAARDGIDIPGRALRLVAYDRVPWPRPDLLHKARRALFGKGYDDRLARFRLKQAYGRLLRRAGDRGVFVMLDGALPSRLLTAFPPDVEVQRVGLKEAVDKIRAFFEMQSDDQACFADDENIARIRLLS